MQVFYKYLTTGLALIAPFSDNIKKTIEIIPLLMYNQCVDIVMKGE